jgi:DNA-binding MarR family transcriptional regulator
MPHMIPQVVSELARDRNLAPIDLRIWISIADQLNMTDFVPLKLESIADDVGASKTSVIRALEALVGAGYLERGDRDGSRGSVTYRIPWQRVFPRRDLPKAA